MRRTSAKDIGVSIAVLMVSISAIVYLGFGSAASLITAAAILVFATLIMVPVTRPIGLLPVLLILGPIVVHRMRIRAEPAVQSLEDLPQELPEQRREVFNAAVIKFVEAGFEFDGYWQVSTTDPHRVFVASFVDRGNPVIGTVATYFPGVPGPGAEAVLALHSLDSRGQFISTTNVFFPSNTSLTPSHRIILPREEDVRVLQRVHTAMIRKFRGPGPARSPLQATWDEYFRSNERTELALWRQRKWVRDAEPGTLRPTWRYAVRCVLAMAWPMPQLVLRRTFKESRRLRRELGV